MQLRPYQQECFEKVLKSRNEHQRSLVVMPTGSGKTIEFSMLTKHEREQGGNTLILADRDQLVQQAADKLYKSTGITAEVEQASTWASPDARVVVGSVQSLINTARRERFDPSHFTQIIIDEAHHCVSDMWQAVLQYFHEDAFVTGFTATPDRSDEREMGQYFQTQAYSVGYFELMHLGYLAPIEVKTVPIKIDLNSVSVTCGEFSGQQLDHALDPYLKEIAQAIMEHAAFRKIIAFLPLIETSKKFARICNEIGLPAVHIDGESPDADRIKEDYALNGMGTVLTNSQLLAEGYDCDTIDCVVDLSPTKSRARYAQRVGRGTRIHPHKTNLLLLDFLWNHKKHHICRPSSLVAKTKEEAELIDIEIAEVQGGRAGFAGDLEQMILPVNLDTVVSETQAKREAVLRAKLEKLSTKKASKLTAEEFAAKYQNLDLAEYQPRYKWEHDPMTVAQSRKISMAGVDPKTITGKGHASQVIAEITKHETLKLASPKQREYMRRRGHPNWQTATATEAGQFFRDQARKDAQKKKQPQLV